ncbi:glycerate kinase family protein [Actinokineospora fastidiosa]|uniref:glycerate kinase family protein n=1 Tax=Actinokineospora fastidiosa TaxID=1816 RepID=UPI001670B531|nr:glycerate kinase [Actinokineospora fastidiosa]
MRVVIAPDCFGGTLTAAEAASAIADGWRRGAPDHDLVLRPLADGGPGFVEVLHTALGGTLRTETVTGPLGEPVTATWLSHDDIAYIESAEACGLHLVPKDRRPLVCETVTTRGVGELLAAARGHRRAVIGLGGSATTDGGAGMLAALGAVAVAEDGTPLPPGGTALARCARIDGGVDGLPEIIAATDVTNPLLGQHGAAATFGPQKGADPAAVERLEAGLARWADVLAAWREPVADEDGAGAAGGLGAAILALGGARASGAGLVRSATGLDAAVAGAGLVITGEGSLDWQSLRGKLVTGVAEAAAERGVPCLALAGQASVGRTRAAAVGISEVHAVAEHAGSVAAAMADPAGTLADLAEHVARQWR